MVLPTLAPLIRFTLPVNALAFLQYFWLEQTWYNGFLSKELANINIACESWREYRSENESLSALPQQLKPETSWQRLVRSDHAMAASQSHLKILGFIPDYAASHRRQSVHFIDSQRYFIEETAWFDGIPFADAFEVCTQWHVREHKRNNAEVVDPLTDQSSFPLTSTNNPTSEIEVLCGVRWKRPCWAASLVSMQTKKELGQVLERWASSARDSLTERKVKDGGEEIEDLIAHHRQEGRLPSFFQSSSKDRRQSSATDKMSLPLKPSASHIVTALRKPIHFAKDHVLRGFVSLSHDGGSERYRLDSQNSQSDPWIWIAS